MLKYLSGVFGAFCPIKTKEHQLIIMQKSLSLCTYLLVCILSLILIQTGSGFNEQVDISGNWVIEYHDYSLLAQHWLETCDAPDWCEGSDINQDFSVDHQDLLEMAGHWQTHAQVIINEIMYHPQSDNHDQEYIELYNRGDRPVDLSGWTLSIAVNMVFPLNTILEPDGYLVVCRNEVVVQSFYGITNTVGNYFDDKLANSGETIVLKDNDNQIIDQVTYSDGSHPVGLDPWPGEPDGAGPSLELFFPESDNDLAQNWGVGQGFTPGVANNPAINGGSDIVINEIMYKPQREELREKFDPANATIYLEDGDDELGEYVELFNKGNATVDLSNWSFTDGIAYTFPPGTSLDPNRLLVVAADPNAVNQRYGITNVFGPFTGGLSDGGERITLRDNNNLVADTVRYNDKHPWPLASDDFGFSLECIDPHEDNSSAANWRASRTPLGTTQTGASQPTWQYVTITGQATSSVIYIFLDGPGEWLIDQITVSGISDAAVNGDFEFNDNGWSKTGNHSDTFNNTTIGFNSAACEHIIATAAGDSAANSLNRSISGMTFGQTYTISCWVAWLSGSETMTIRLSGSTSSNGIYIDVERVVGGDWDLADDFSVVSNPHTVTLGDGQQGIWEYLNNNGLAYDEDVQNHYSSELPTPSIGWIDNGSSTPWISLNLFQVGADGIAQGSNTNFVAGDVGGHAVTGARWTTVNGGKFLITATGYNARIQGPPNSANALGRWTTLQITDPVNGVQSFPIDPVVNNSSANPIGISYDVALAPNQSVTVNVQGADWVGINFTVSRISEVVGSLPGTTLEPPVGGFFGNGTPGGVNSVRADQLPPLVSELSHIPLTPSSSDSVIVTAYIAASNPLASVQLETILNTDTTGPFLTMFDDGTNGDVVAADGLYSVTVSPQSSQTLVHYRVHAQDDQGNLTRFPYDDDPSPTRAYYHYDGEITTGMTFFHLFITQDNINFLNSNPRTLVYADCSLVIDHIAYPHIGMRYRGRGSRFDPKRPRKFHFNKDNLYNGNRSYDTMIRLPFESKVAFDIFEAVGVDNLESELIRLHINDAFWGVYIGFESPTGSWIDKHNLHPDTEVYKSRTVETGGFGDLIQPYNSDLFHNLLDTDYEFWGSYNKKMNPLQPPIHIRDLVNNLNDLTDEQLLPWMDAHVDIAQWFNRWHMTVYMRIDDFGGHNNYHYLPGEPGSKWKWLGYDFDSMGRFGPMRLFYCDGVGDEPRWQRNKLCERVSSNPTLSRIYLLTMRQLLQDYPSTVFNPMIDSLFAQIAPDIAAETAKWGTAYIRTSTTQTKNDFAAQRSQMLSNLNAYNLPADSDIPVASPAGGIYVGSVSVSLPLQPGWDGWYTLDGSDPRLSNTRQLYSVPIPINQSATLKAAASETGEPLSSGKWTGMTEQIYIIQ